MIDFSNSNMSDKQIKDMLKSELRSNKVVDLLPSEKNSIQLVILNEMKSYECTSSFSAINTLSDLESAIRRLANRLENRISEVGFVASVSVDMQDPDNYDMYENGAIEWHPVVSIVDRIVAKKAFDHEKATYEVRHGLADGKVGRYKNGTEWTDEPDSKKSFLI